MQHQPHTKEFLESLTPETAFEFLKKGNERFAEKQQYSADLSQQVKDTADSQHPFAAVVSCMDSRTSVELAFGRGIGEVFSIRIAGNIVNEDIIGSLEFAVKAKEVKLVAVLGHTTCGAIAGACGTKPTDMPHLNRLLNRIKPAVEEARKAAGGKEPSGDEVAIANVRLGINEILSQSDIVREYYDNGSIGIVGGMYDTATGKINFFEKRFKAQ